MSRKKTFKQRKKEEKEFWQIVAMNMMAKMYCDYVEKGAKYSEKFIEGKK